TRSWSGATMTSGPPRLWLLRDAAPLVARLSPVIRDDAKILDVDVDARLAVVAEAETVQLVDLDHGVTVAELRTPAGSAPRPTRRAEIERGGDRIYVQADRDVAVFQRSTGALIGAAQLAAGGTIAF